MMTDPCETCGAEAVGVMKVVIEIEKIPEEWEDLIGDHGRLIRSIIEDRLNNPPKRFMKMLRNARVIDVEESINAR